MFERNYFITLLLLGTLFCLSACSTSADGDFAGREYVPDMSHPIAYEANLYDYYSLNRWGTADDYYKMVQPRKPVAGTIARGYVGIHYAQTNTAKEAVMMTLQGKENASAISMPINGSVPYYYEDTEEERTRAMAEIVQNPYPITEKGLKEGKELYVIYCGSCHGDKADGSGYLVRDDGGMFPAQPANFILDEFVTASNGRYYHAIMYGKNMMESHADKLSYEERWQVIHYIRSLQAKEKKMVYSEEANTLNSHAVSASQIELLSSNDVVEEEPVVEEVDDHGDHDDGHN